MRQSGGLSLRLDTRFSERIPEAPRIRSCSALAGACVGRRAQRAGNPARQGTNADRALQRTLRWAVAPVGREERHSLENAGLRIPPAELSSQPFVHLPG